MADVLMLSAALALIGSATWLIVSLIGIIRHKTRQKAKRGIIISPFAIAASYSALIVATSMAEPPQTPSKDVAKIHDVSVEADGTQKTATEPKVTTSAGIPVPTARPSEIPTRQSAKRDLMPTQQARLMCRALDQTGLASAPCTYSGWNSTITITIDMAVGEARNLCQLMVKYSRDQKLGLSGWRLEIRSPYSGSTSMAFCMLA